MAHRPHLVPVTAGDGGDDPRLAIVRVAVLQAFAHGIKTSLATFEARSAQLIDGALAEFDGVFGGDGLRADPAFREECHRVIAPELVGYMLEAMSCAERAAERYRAEVAARGRLGPSTVTYWGG